MRTYPALLLASLLVCSMSSQAQVVFYQESTDEAGNTSTGFYEEFGTGWYPGGSSVKSTAEGLVGNRSCFSRADYIGDASYRFYPAWNPSFDAGKRWDIHVTVPGGYDSIDAEASIWTISPDGVDRNMSGIATLVGHGPPDGYGPAGNKWMPVASNVAFEEAGGYIEFQESYPQVNRFYADAVRYTENLSGSETLTPTETPTMTPTATPSSTPYSATEEARALWVTRWNYTTASDIDSIVTNAKNYNFNILLFQIRGNATAFYDSAFEPWAWELTGSNPSTLDTDPGWDPLAVACAKAHEAGLELHAYVNLFPAWKETIPPPAAVDQLWNTHNDWFMQNVGGDVMWPQDWWDYWYTFIDPGVPEVKQYLHDVMMEIVNNYPVDGLHYDYIRYPAEVGDWAYNATSVARFEAAYGGTPQALPSQWGDWKRTQISEIVAAVYPDAEQSKPSIKISAAVNKSYTSAYTSYAQDYRHWMQNDVLDIDIPMLYIQNTTDFTNYVTDHIANCSGKWVLPGLGAHNTEAGTLLQLIQISRDLGAQGVALFAYPSLFPGHAPNAKANTILDGPFELPASIPPMEWKSTQVGHWFSY